MLDPNHTKMHLKIFKGSQQKDFVRWKMQKLMPKSMQYATHEIIGPVKGYMTCEKNTESENQKWDKITQWSLKCENTEVGH